MRPRDLITLLGGAAAPLTVAMRAAAQQRSKIPRVGMLTPAETDATPGLEAFRKGIRDLGYVEGRTILLDFRTAKGKFDDLPSLGAELVHIPVDIIVTDSTSAALGAFGATHTIPIVMAMSGGGPVALGLTTSVARPSGNVTGLLFRSSELSGKRLQLLKQALPALRASAFCSTQRASSDRPRCAQPRMLLGFWRTACCHRGQHARRIVRAWADPPVEYRRSPGADRCHVLEQSREDHRACGGGARARPLPGARICLRRGLIAYGANVPDHFRQAAGYVDRILRGATPGDLPINQSSKLDFVVNLRTASALGLKLASDLLSVAAEVIE
jgi:putative tryptophan/tyrosine transport system substrate-binding protein